MWIGSLTVSAPRALDLALPGRVATPIGFIAGLERDYGTRLTASPDAVHHFDCSVLFWGHIANRAALVSLCFENIDQRDISDAHLLAAAFKRWGTAAQSHVLGEYCALVFDRSAGCAIAFADALGLRPLYYAQRAGRIVVASHIEHILKTSRDWEIDEQFIGAYLTNTIADGSMTVYKEIRVVPSGHTLVWNQGGISLRRTWSLESVDDLEGLTEDEYDERFCAILFEAVRASSGERTWSELSGGLDSSSVVCVARRCGVERLEALSIVYSSSRTSDEREWIDEVVSRCGIRLHTIDEDIEMPFAQVPDRFLPEPSHVSLMWRLFKRYESLIHEHDVDVMLSGFGGDQVMVGDIVNPVYLADRALAANFGGVLRELRQWQASCLPTRPIRDGFSKAVVRPLSRYWRRLSLANERSVFPPWIDREFLQKIALEPGYLSSPQPRMPSVAGQYYWERVWRVSVGSGQYWSHLLRGVELRYPLLYRPLVEFMYALPWEHKLRPGRDRVIQRRALKGILPEKTRARLDKRGPDEAFLRGLQAETDVWHLLNDRPRVVERGYVESAAWGHALRTARLGFSEWFGNLLSACSLELWLRQFDP